MTQRIRVGNAQAFWGDRSTAAEELLGQEPNLDYLTMDYLAEVSMSILASQQQRDPSRGYPADFVDVVRRLAPYWKRGGKCRLIANAGGLNPEGCATACRAALEEAGCPAMVIGVVQGDDVVEWLRASTSELDGFRNLDDGRSIDGVRDRLVTANAYMGCEGIVEALKAGANIVITGRVADPSMVVGACIHAFGWSHDDWQRLAGATVAGHLLECGTHVSGGIATDWLSVPDPAHIGFPIAEIDDSGRCVITKGQGAGGRVDTATVKEQLVYEIGDPAAYLSPDVRVSFLKLTVTQEGSDRVLVQGAIGMPPPHSLKVSATYRDGFRAAGTLTVLGWNAAIKARRAGEMVLQRLQDRGYVYRDSLIEILGTGASVPLDLPAWQQRPVEVVLRVAVESESREAMDAFAKELIPLVTAGPQGTTGYAEGRPSVHTVYRYWPCLIGRDRVPYSVSLVPVDAHEPRTVDGQRTAARSTSHTAHPHDWTCSDGHVGEERPPYPCLLDVAYGRSGDKGTGANVGILARSPEFYRALDVWLTVARVEQLFAPLGVESVQRFELPNLLGFNFLLKGVLKRSLRNDAQGKALAQAMLLLPLTEFPVPLTTTTNGSLVDHHL